MDKFNPRCLVKETDFINNYGGYITGFQEKETCSCVSIGVTLDDFPSHLNTPSLEQWMMIGEITVSLRLLKLPDYIMEGLNLYGGSVI